MQNGENFILALNNFHIVAEVRSEIEIDDEIIIYVEHQNKPSFDRIVEMLMIKYGFVADI